MSVKSKKTYPDITSSLDNIAMRIVDIAFQAFFDDTRALVEDGVMRDINSRLAEASPDDYSRVAARTKERKTALQSWMNQEKPLSYTQSSSNESHETFDFLVDAITHDKRQISHGLPGWNANSKTPLDFVQSLFDMSKPTNPSNPHAPVIKDGSFLPVLKVAHSSLVSLVKDMNTAAQQDFLERTFRNALVVFKVNFFPFHQENTQVRGARFRVPVYNSWGPLGLAVTSNNSNRSSPPPLPQVPPTQIAYNLAVSTDRNAPWIAKNIKLTTMRSILKRTNLPADFKYHPTGTAYVDETYDWVKQNYTPTNPIHHLALLVAVIVSSSIIPFHNPPPDVRSLMKGAKSRREVRNRYLNMAWASKGTRGMTDKSIFVSMITTFIIALYEPQSPLRVYMLASPLTGLGPEWTTKYSASFLISHSSFHLFIFYFFLRNERPQI